LAGASADASNYNIDTPDSSLKNTFHTLELYVSPIGEPAVILVETLMVTFRSECEFQRDGITPQTFKNLSSASFMTLSYTGQPASWTFTPA